jgi:predicted nucleic acid-binding protein
MRVVADANVLVSAALARSPQAPSVLTLDAALDGRLELIISPQLLREIAMVLARPRSRLSRGRPEASLVRGHHAAPAR